jgi:hypothetical protein
MKIIEQTPTRLKFQNGSFFWVLGGTLFGLPFFLAGLAVILFFGKVATLQCTRLEPKQVRCEYIVSGLLTKKSIQIPVGELQGADVEVNQDSDGNTYRITLLTQNQGRVPFTDSFSSGREKYSKANQIKAFVNDPEQMSLQVNQDDRWFAYPFGSIFAIAGGSIIFYALNISFKNTYTFDRQTRDLKLSRQGLFGTSKKEFKLHEIKQAEVTESKDSDGDTTYKAELVLRSGERLPLHGIVLSNNYQKTVDTINQFLGVK